VNQELPFPADLHERVAKRLGDPLPGRSTHRAMGAELSYGRHTGEPPYGARRAAVIAPLYRHEGRWHVLLTVRSTRLANHSGQISLPGGAVEPGEASRTAALRELEEELGIEPRRLQVAGELSSVYVLASNFLVNPWIGFLRRRPLVRPNLAEVSRVLEVPLEDLTHPASRGAAIITRGALRFRAPHYAWQGHRIWGGTAMILSELITVLRQASAGSTSPA
jgi:8-oxo-dGTP pyrophosphatase MutT (NUDIX family)